MTWLPEWRVTVGDDVYTTVTSVSYATGRLDIDRQATAGYCRVEIVNVDNSPFTINITEPISLELKNSSGIYTKMFTGTVSDFNIGVRSPDESGFITTGTILGIGSLARLAKAVYNTALASALDGEQIELILEAALSDTWNEIDPTVTWATYPSTGDAATWQFAETLLGNVDQGEFGMIQINASPSAKSQTLVDQIANSALGIISEGADGLVYYDDADHRDNYLTTYGYTDLDATYATPSSIQSQTQTARLRNSFIYKYGIGYATILTISAPDSIATYGLFERSLDSNILTFDDMANIGTREILLRNLPRGSLGAIRFRLDNPDLPSAMLDDLLIMFCGTPVFIDNLPNNLLGGNFEGFVENIAVNATPTYVDMTLYISAKDFSMPPGVGAP
jgi:hypothetical protein